MTDAQMLEDILDAGVKAGWDGQGCGFNWVQETESKLTRQKTIEWLLHWDGVWKATLFNHDFARALFGDKYYMKDDSGGVLVDEEYKKDEALNTVPGLHVYCIAVFEYHLQQAVISDNPIRYMYQAVLGGSNAD
jgi:hypothetical protein